MTFDPASDPERRAARINAQNLYARPGRFIGVDGRPVPTEPEQFELFPEDTDADRKSS